MLVFRKKVKDFSFMEKETRTSTFIKVLIKTCIISVSVTDQKIKFDILKCFIYLIVATTPSVLYYYFMSEPFIQYMRMENNSINQAR